MGLRVRGPRRAIICCIIFTGVLSQDNSETEDQSTNELDDSGLDSETTVIAQDELDLNTDEQFTIENDGCTIARLDILDPSIRKLVNYPTNVLSCGHNTHPLLDKNRTHIWVKTENFLHYNITDENFYCSYKSFHQTYTKPKKLRNIAEPLTSRVTYLDVVKFIRIVTVHDEFIRVICYSDESEVYDQFFAFTPLKPYTVFREKPFSSPNTQGSYNVLVMGVGSMSRLNFHRTMPNTLKFLDKKGAIELLGYNNVANVKFLNLIPILLGMNDSELERTCGKDEFSIVNRCPFIWERFKDAGYYTALGEDTACSETFSSKSVGYSSSPTDYYLRPFIQESKRIIVNATLCLEDKYYFQVILDYIKSLTTTLHAYKLFGLFWESSLSYNDWNSPMLMDHRYEELLKYLDNSDYLKKTFLIILSDHGTKFGDLIKTKQGRLEERLPFVSILTPPSFREKFSIAYENLRRNAGRLTTPFDIHNTLVDLIDLNAIENKELLRRSVTPYKMARGISLFQSVPSNRTCSAAEIEVHWCSCLKSDKTSVSCKTARLAAEFMIHELNVLLSSYPQCGKLQVEEILGVKEWSNFFEIVPEWRDITVTVRANPGGGLFRATLRLDHNNQWALMGTVSRLNRCDINSSCISDYQLKIYCSCN